MKKTLKKIPKFNDEKIERAFWQTHDSTEYVDYASLENWSLPNLKLTTRSVTFRLPVSLIDRVKQRARQMDMPYQTLFKQIVFMSLENSNPKFQFARM